MRVLHFCKNSPASVGGMEQVIDQLARGAARLGIEVDVLHLGHDGSGQPLARHGYRVHCANLDFEFASTGFSFSAFTRFRHLARAADVVHYHFPWPFADLVHFVARSGKPSVVTYHSDVIRQKRLLKLYRPLQHRFLSSMDRIVATSPNYFASSAVLQEFSGKVDVIPIGLDSDSYPAASPERIAYWKARVGMDFFLFVGVLRYYKGLHVLLQAARGLERGIVIVGAGPIERELKAHAAELRLANVRFLGQLPEADKVALLQLCRGVVFPSHLRAEAFGVSLLEGAMYGKPMISSEIGTGTSFVNLAGRTGLVVPAGDADALHAAMQHLADHPSEALRMGARAAWRYQRFFTAGHMVARYADLYRSVIAERAAGAGDTGR